MWLVWSSLSSKVPVHTRCEHAADLRWIAPDQTRPMRQMRMFCAAAAPHTYPPRAAVRALWCTPDQVDLACSFVSPRVTTDVYSWRVNTRWAAQPWAAVWECGFHEHGAISEIILVRGLKRGLPRGGIRFVKGKRWVVVPRGRTGSRPALLVVRPRRRVRYRGV